MFFSYDALVDLRKVYSYYHLVCLLFFSLNGRRDYSGTTIPSLQSIGVPTERLPVVDSFKYLGSTLQAEGGCEKDVTSRIQSGWNRWREMSGVICDKKVPEALKNKIYKTAIRPAMTYGGECWPIRKSDQRRINTTEMKMLRWMQGKTRKDHIRNTTICRVL